MVVQLCLIRSKSQLNFNHSKLDSKRFSRDCDRNSCRAEIEQKKFFSHTDESKKYFNLECLITR